MLYQDAFDGLSADVRYTYSRAGFEADVIIRQSPPPPEAFGLNPETTVFEVVSEVHYEGEAASRLNETDLSGAAQAGEEMVQRHLTDEWRTIGQTTFVAGKAFETNAKGAADVPVVKRWEVVDGQTFLREQVEYGSIGAALRKLEKNDELVGQTAVAERRWRGASREIAPSTGPMSIVGNEAEKPGLIIDYITINGSTGGYDFTAGTYFLSANFQITGGNLRIYPNAILKYASGVSMTFASTGTVSCPNSGWRYLTAKDDNSIGETISGSTGYPVTKYANPALQLYNVTQSSTMKEMEIRYAHVGLSVYTLHHFLSQSSILETGTAFRTDTASGWITASYTGVCADTVYGGSGTTDLYSINYCPDITINTSPASINEDEPATINYTVADDSTAVASIACTIGGRGDAGHVMVHDWSGPNSGANPRINHVFGIANAFGPAYWWVRASDSSGLWRRKFFSLTINPVNDPPTFSFPRGYQNLGTVTDTPTEYLAFVVTDVENDSFTVTHTESTEQFQSVEIQGTGAVKILRATPKTGVLLSAAPITLRATDSFGVYSDTVISVDVAPDNANPDGAVATFGAAGGLDLVDCVGCGAGGGGGSSGSQDDLGSCSVPDLQQFVRTVVAPDTKNINVPNTINTDVNQFSSIPGGTEGCVYELEVEWQGRIRQSGADLIGIGEISYMSPGGLGYGAMIDTGVRIGRTKMYGSCHKKWGFDLKTPGSHGTDSGMSGAYVRIISIRAVGAYNANDPNCHGGCKFGDFPSRYAIGSVDVSLEGGSDRFGRQKPRLLLYGASASTDLASARSLRLTGGGEGIEEILDPNGSGSIRQVRTTAGLIDIVTLSNSCYVVKYYPTNALVNGGTKDGSGLYILDGSAPLKSVEVRNPTPGNGNCLRLGTSHAGSANICFHQFDFVPAAAGSGDKWQLLSGNASSLSEKELVASGSGERTERFSILKTNGLPNDFQRQHRYRTNGFGVRLVEATISPTNAPRTALYSYHTNGGNHTVGKLAKSIFPSGGWEMLDYATNGQISTVWRGIGNAGVSTNSGSVQQFNYIYTPNAGSGDVGAYRAHLPRCEVELRDGVEVARRYFVYLKGEKKEYVCINPGDAWTNSSNLITITRRFTSGRFTGELERVIAPDGTETAYDYVEYTNFLVRTTTTGVAFSNVFTAGTRAVSTIGLVGETLTNAVFDVASGLLLSREVHSSFDLERRAQRVDYLDGTFELRTYGCCGIEQLVDREGVTNVFGYDELNRKTTEDKLGVKTQWTYDAAGRVTKVERRVGADTRVIAQMVYDESGALIEETDASGSVTKFSRSTDGIGQTVRTTTLAFGTALQATRVETYAKSGALVMVSGTAVAPRRFEHGVETDGGMPRKFSRQIVLNSDLSDSAEWVKTYYDGAGRAYKTVRNGAGGVGDERVFNGKGQLVSARDADGVRTLSQYNALGESELTAVDLNSNGVLDLGLDRVTKVVRDITTNGSGWVIERTRSFGFPQFGLTNGVLLRTTERTVDGLFSKTVDATGTNTTLTVNLSNGRRNVTNVLASGRSQVDRFEYGKLIGRSEFDAAGSTLTSVTFEYDSWGRQTAIIDARNGPTISAFDNSDRVVSVTMPASGMGDGPVSMVNEYDALGRVWRRTEPDGATVTNEYFASGLLKKVSGARVYPVAYTYDPQGRMLTMTTWRDSGSGAGSSVTSWTYDASGGYMSSKIFADGSSVLYSNSLGGRLKSRAWARVISGSTRLTTSYKYGFDDAVSTNQHPDLVEVSYNDGLTATTSTEYDRMGRAVGVTSGTLSLRQFFADSGTMLGQSYTGGSLGGLRVTNQFDSLTRRQTFAVFNGGSSVGSAISYGYDGAGRLSTVGDGSYSATYGYPIMGGGNWDSVTYRQGAITRATTSRLFDRRNRVRSISTTLAAGSGSLGSEYVYNTAGLRTRRTDADGSYWVYDYDALGQVTSGRRYWSDGVPVAGQQFEYSHDDIGNRKLERKGGDASGSGLQSVGYAVNSLNQYTTRTNSNAVDIIGVASAAGNVTINGSAAYRRGEYFWRSLGVSNGTGPIWQSVTGSVWTLSGSTNVVGAVRAPLATETLTYDADGNLLQDSLWIYSWDGENRLLSVESRTNVVAAGRRKVSWEYDPLGRRIRQTSGVWNSSGSAYTNASDVKLIYDGWLCMAELRSSDNGLLRQYAWGLDASGSTSGAGGVGGMLWMKPSGGAAHFGAYDGNGNVVGLVDGSSGNVSAQYEYDPFGNTLRITGSGTIARDNGFRFSTKRADDTTDLILYEYRVYSPSLGRWPNRDPLEERGGLNLYGFAKGDPVGIVDFDGRFTGIEESVLLLYVAGVAICGATTAWLNSPAGKEAMHNVSMAATSVADALAEGLKAAAEQCDKCFRRNKKCLPCIPPVGSIAYRVDLPPSPPHNGIPTPHSHMFVMVQRAADAKQLPCNCEWKEILKDPIPGVHGPPVSQALGGGIAP